jgi:hypothetical protein
LVLVLIAGPAWAQKTRPVQITSVPEGATVWLGDKEGEPLGTTPLEAQLAPGEYTTIFELAGHVPVFETLIVDAIKDKKKAKVPVTLKVALVPAISKLTVKGDAPPTAKVLIDGKEKGGLPLTLEVDPGAHQVQVMIPGREPYEEWVELEGGQEHEVTVSLEGMAPVEPPKPKKKLGPRPPLAIARAGVDVSWRRFRYENSGDAMTTAPFDANGRVMGRFEAEIGPWRLAPKAHRIWPLSLILGAGFSPQDTAVRGSESANFNHRLFEAGLRYRLGINDRVGLAFDAGYQKLLYTFAGDLDYALPDVNYNVVRIGVRGEGKLGILRPWLGVENRIVAGGGKLPDRFKSADANGFGLTIGVLARFLDQDRVEVGLGYDLARFGWTFAPVDNPPPPPAHVYMATGGTDTYHTIRFWVGGAY